MPRYGLVKYDYNCLLKYEIVKKKKKKYTIGYVSFHSSLIFHYLFISFFLLLSFFFFFHIFTLHSFHPKSYNVSKFVLFLGYQTNMIDRYRFYVCCILNPITMKISLDCDQCFSKRMTRLFRLVASRNSFCIFNSVSDTIQRHICRSYALFIFAHNVLS